MTLKLGSLFDGSGGFPLAGVLHGVEPVWASEIEPYPIKVTKARFPGMKHLGSVLDVNGADVEPVDIITFGSPCQDLSVAGKQAGLENGARSNLFYEAIRIIKEMRNATDNLYPRCAIWENVPGAFSSNNGKDFQSVLKAFAQINDEAADVPRPSTGKWNPAGTIVGNGWSVAWRTFDAQYWGVPQRRKRIYLIADFGSERAGEILFEQNRVRGDSAESGTAGQGAAGDAAGSVGRGGECLTPWDVQSRRINAENGTWPAIYGGEGGGHGYVLQGASADAQGSVGRGVQCLNPHDTNTQRIYDADGIYPAIPANSNGGQNRQAICFQACGDRDNPNISVSDKAYCLPANPMSDRGQAVCFQQNQREEVRDMGDKTGAIAANGGAHQTNYVCINANDQVEYINGREIKANLSSAWGQGAAGDAEGGAGRSGQPIAYDQYNFAVSDVEASLGVNCGMTTGRNGVIQPAGDAAGGVGRGVFSFMGGQGSRARSIAWTEEATPPLKAVPSGSNTVPTIVFKERAGCPGGGKGILCGDKPFTLSTLTDQAVCYAARTAQTQANGIGVVVVQDGSETARTLAARYDSSPCADRGQNVVCYAVRTAQTNANGVGVAQEAHTLDGANGQAVCYQNKVGALCADDYKGTNQQYVDQDKVVVHVMERPLDCMHDQQIALYTKQAIGHYCELKVASTQQARQYKSADDLVVSSAKPLRKYIIRRLTPLECCRLQGFPDCWCSDIGIENPTEDDIAFWTEVWETHRRVMGVSKKPKSRRKIIKWLKDPYSDSAEYKMWGNGLALPNAAYAVGCAVRLIEARVQDE